MKTFRAFGPSGLAICEVNGIIRARRRWEAHGVRITVQDETRQDAIERIKAICRVYRLPINETLSTLRQIALRRRYGECPLDQPE